jgi:hypothetical protein
MFRRFTGSGPQIAILLVAMFGSRFITALLIAMWLLTPDVLCLLPGVKLTKDEHECCEQMGEQCGRVPMPEIHKCCQTVKRSDAMIASKMTDYPETQTGTVAFVIPEFKLSDETEHLRYWLRFESSSPPPLNFQESYDILRI